MVKQPLVGIGDGFPRVMGLRSLARSLAILGHQLWLRKQMLQHLTQAVGSNLAVVREPGVANSLQILRRVVCDSVLNLLS